MSLGASFVFGLTRSFCESVTGLGRSMMLKIVTVTFSDLKCVTVMGFEHIDRPNFVSGQVRLGHVRLVD